MGDFNINVLRNSPLTRQFKQFSSRLGLKLTVKTITRPDSSTCIDNILLNKNQVNKFTTIVTPELLADHYTIDLYTKHDIEAIPIKTKITYRQFNEVNNNIFIARLRELDWDAIDELDVEEGTNVMMNNLKTTLEASYPLITRSLNKNIDCISPWMTKELLVKRFRLKKLAVKAKAREGLARLVYKNENKIFKNELKAAKNKYIRENLVKNCKNSKKLWDIINKHVVGKSGSEQVNNIKLNNITVTNEKVIAEAFSEHFKMAAENLHNQVNIDPEKHKEYLPPSKPSWEFIEVTEPEVLKVINSMAPKTSNGVDGISNKILKLVKFIILKPITKLFNKSITMGVFPTALKAAKIVPIYKKGELNNINNYRPISLLPTMSKIWEKLMNIQLQEKLDEYNIIINDQYGFRRGHSTINAVQKLVFEVNKLKRDRKVVCAVFIDVSKAFDSCHHDVILNKLANIGLSNNSLLLLRSYLNNRNQFVYIGDERSKSTSIKHGVGQGTILGPLLFKLYIADMYMATQLKVIHFADDTTFICSADNKASLIRLVNEELIKINEWFNSNFLFLHPDKSRVMMFGNDDNFDITLNNHVVTKCGNNSNEKYFNMLGIRLDQKLNWQEHLQYINNKISKGIYLLWKFKYALDTKTKLLLYHSFIRSHILYGISLWGNSRGCEMRKLIVTHKKSIRGIVIGKIHTEPVLKKHNLLSLQDEVRLDVIKHAWLYIHDRMPAGIKDSLEEMREQRNLRHNRIMNVPRTTRNTDLNQIDIVLPSKINDMYDSLNNTNTIGKLITSTKKTLISLYQEAVICNNVGCIECRV